MEVIDDFEVEYESAALDENDICAIRDVRKFLRAEIRPETFDRIFPPTLAKDCRKKLVNYFDNLTLCELTSARVRAYRETWRVCELAPAVQLQVFSRYLSLATSQITRHLLAQPEHCITSIRALQKLVFLHLELLSLTTCPPNSAAYDAVTGLPGRTLFLDHLQTSLAQHTLAVLILEFDHVHDSATDVPCAALLLRDAAASFESIVREHDFLARIGKLAFGFILSGVGSEAHVALAANKILASAEDLLSSGKAEFFRLPHIGVALAPDHGSDSETLVQHAEIAKQVAKSNHHRYAIFDSERERRSRRKRGVEAALRKAIEENELSLHYQPQADLKGGRIVGAEALLRWESEGAPPIGVILETAEETGLITDLTPWVIKTALRHSAEFHKAGMDINVSVNLSASNLSDPELPEFIEQQLKMWGVKPEVLILELTEGAMMKDAQNCTETLLRLKNCGIQIAIDDFGTGYSSMEYLKKLPVDELKVDQSFIRNILNVSADERIVRTVIDLAHSFGLRVVAEGVENGETADALKRFGCDIMQGYFLSRPIPQEKFKKWWRDQRLSTALIA